MRPSFAPRLINKSPFDDPGVLITFAFQKRAILFDLGDVRALSSRDLLKVSHVFVTHAHMDHFLGFDHLVRILLGRDKDLHVYGPAGFIQKVAARLSGYTWNLVENYENRFCITATEVRESSLRSQTFLCQDGFAAREPVEESGFDGVLLDEPGFRVRARILDHKVPCLGLALEEKFHVNVMADKLEAMGLSTGPWLSRLKEALYAGDAPDTELSVPLPDGGRRLFTLGDLAARITIKTLGQKIAYITDAAYHGENEARILDLAKDADVLFIEAAFSHEDRLTAAEKSHLTALQAGALARAAGARQIVLLHFSPRYTDREQLLIQEAQRAFTAQPQG